MLRKITMCALYLCLSLHTSRCKGESEPSNSGDKNSSPQNSPLTGSNTTGNTTGPITTTASASASAIDNLDPKSLTQDQWARLPASSIEQLLLKLRDQNSSEQLMMTKIQTFNALMCTELENLKSQCPAQALIVSDTGISDLACTTTAPSVPTEIEVEIERAGGYTFRLKANSFYFSDEITESGRQKILFKRKDSRMVKAPRFKDVTSLSLVRVQPGSTFEQGYLQNTLGIEKNLTTNTDKNANIRMRIYINSSLLMGDDDVGSVDNWLRPVLPDNNTVRSELIVPAQQMNAIGRSEKCTVTLEKINELKREAEKKINAPQ